MATVEHKKQRSAFGDEAIEHYLREALGDDIEVREIRKLGEDEHDAKSFGYGKPLLIRTQRNGREQRLVLHTLSSNPFDHQYAADRAGELYLAYDTFSDLPRHIHAHDLGTVTRDGTLVSLGQPEEFFLLTDYAEGQAYAQDLSDIAERGELQVKDRQRVDTLAAYLAQIHSTKSDRPDVYQRRIRETVGDGEGIVGMLDTFPPHTPGAETDILQQIEGLCVPWRWTIKSHTHRLSQVHGDFHPWNVLFRETNELTLLDRSRGAWGEPADDVAAMDINYVFFSLRAHGRLTGPFEDLHRRFWDIYLSHTQDAEITTVAPLFYVWRALVLAHPWWYPDLSEETRAALLRFVMAMLHSNRFDPEAVNDYLR